MLVCDFCKSDKDVKGVGLSFGFNEPIPVICSLCPNCYEDLLRETKGLIVKIKKEKNHE